MGYFVLQNLACSCKSRIFPLSFLIILHVKPNIFLQRTRRERTPPREHSPAPVRDRDHRTRTPPASVPVSVATKEDVAVHSGSEEGEIEEE